MHEKSQMAFFAALFDCLIFKFYIVLQCTKKLEKLPKLENFRAVHNWGAHEKSWRPLEQVQLANQIIGPLRSWLKKVKYLLPVCQILWCEESHSDFLLSLFILMSENIEKKETQSQVDFFEHVQIT